MAERPWLLVDFDGVLAVDLPSRREGELRARGWLSAAVILDEGPERICFNPRAGGWLSRLAWETGARLAWATMREAVATSRCAPLAGLPLMPVIPVNAAIWAGEASTKAESVVPWTEGAPFAWFEDRDQECEEADYLANGQPHLMIRVDPRWGLGEEHVDEAREWLAGLRAEGARS